MLSERERTLTFDILKKMLHNAEMEVRRIIAEQLSDLPDAPRELITLQANDEIEVAFTILQDSAVLEDEDLIEVIRHRAKEHQLTIAARNTVSEAVSSVLVETGDGSVITALLKNSGSALSQTTMEYLVEESKRVDAFQEPILRRGDLDPDLAKRMYMWVTAALRKFILDNFDLDKTALDDLLEKTADAVLKETPAKSDELAMGIDNEGLGLAKTMIHALRDGEIFLFEATFRRLTGLRNTLVKRIMFEPGGEGLAIACKATGITIKDFTTIYSLSRLRSENSKSIDSSEIKQILEFYEKMPVMAAKETLANWRRNMDYQKAIREINLGP